MSSTLANIMTLSQHESDLHMHCRLGNVSDVERLLAEGTAHSGLDARGESCMAKAIQKRHVEVVKLLLASGYRPSQSERDLAGWCSFPNPELLEVVVPPPLPAEVSVCSARSRAQDAVTVEDSYEATSILGSLIDQIPEEERNPSQRAVSEILTFRSHVLCDGLWGALGNIGHKEYKKTSSLASQLKMPAIDDLFRRIDAMLADHGLHAADVDEAGFYSAQDRAGQVYGDLDDEITDAMLDSDILSSVKSDFNRYFPEKNLS